VNVDFISFHFHSFIEQPLIELEIEKKKEVKNKKKYKNLNQKTYEIDNFYVSFRIISYNFFSFQLIA